MTYKVPCGRTMGHGEACSAGYLCDACITIDKLMTQVRVRDQRIAILEQRLQQHSKEGGQL